MKFEEAVANSEARGSYRVGLKALTEGDRNRLSCQNTRKISGSLNLDSALAQIYPNASRWDYGIGIRKKVSNDKAIWVEVHPGDGNQVSKIIEKLRWLKNWLKNNGGDLLTITEGDYPYVWVASGRVSFQRNSPQARRLALAGIRFPQEHYIIETK